MVLCWCGRWEGKPKPRPHPEVEVAEETEGHLLGLLLSLLSTCILALYLIIKFPHKWHTALCPRSIPAAYVNISHVIIDPFYLWLATRHSVTRLIGNNQGKTGGVYAKAAPLASDFMDSWVTARAGIRSELGLPGAVAN